LELTGCAANVGYTEEMGASVGTRTLTGDANNRFEKKTILENTQMTGLLLELYYTILYPDKGAELVYCAGRGLLRLASPPLVRAKP
jgi:hypothetical protein